MASSYQPRKGWAERLEEARKHAPESPHPLGLPPITHKEAPRHLEARTVRVIAAPAPRYGFIIQQSLN